MNATWLSEVFLHHTFFCAELWRHFSIVIWQHWLLVGTRQARLRFSFKMKVTFFFFFLFKTVYMPDKVYLFCSLAVFVLLSCSSSFAGRRLVFLDEYFFLFVGFSVSDSVFLHFIVFIFYDYHLLSLMFVFSYHDYLKPSVYGFIFQPCLFNFFCCYFWCIRFIKIPQFVPFYLILSFHLCLHS